MSVTQIVEGPGSATNITLNGKHFLARLEWKSYIKVSNKGIEYDNIKVPWKNAKSWVVGSLVNGVAKVAPSGPARRSTTAIKPEPYNTDSVTANPPLALPSFPRAEVLKHREKIAENAWWETDYDFQNTVISMIIKKIKEAVCRDEKWCYVFSTCFVKEKANFFSFRPTFITKWLADNGYEHQWIDAILPTLKICVL